jgi:hypothetical protein
MSDSTNLQFFTGFTLVDITATGITRGDDPDDVARNQQRNWETLLQCIGLRTQPHHIQGPFVNSAELDQLEFGDFYTGRHQIWTWGWAVERSGIYDLDEKPLAGLLQDLEQVPIITGLEETARFMLPIFYPYGTIKNIYVKQHKVE